MTRETRPGTTASVPNDGSDGQRGSFVHENWAAAAAGQADRNPYEVPFYSDAPLRGAAPDLGPYGLLNAVSVDVPMYGVEVALFARVRLHVSQWFEAPMMEVTDTSRYHGGTHDDELAALLSLFMGVRLKAGRPTRTFFGEDPLGRPQADTRRPIARLSPLYGKPMLQLPREGADIEQAAMLLKKLCAKPHRFSIAFAKAARLYQEAIWVAESDPERAWLLLISAAEAAAVYEVTGDVDPVSVLKKARKRLWRLLKDDTALLAKVAEEVKNLFGPTQKFIDFLIGYCPLPPPARPPEAFQIPWSKPTLAEALSALYGARSDTLHNGTGFPGPLCSPPMSFPDWAAPEESPSGSGFAQAGGTWLPEAAPMSLLVFHHIVRGALLNWLDGTRDLFKNLQAVAPVTAISADTPPPPATAAEGIPPATGEHAGKPPASLASELVPPTPSGEPRSTPESSHPDPAPSTEDGALKEV